MTGKVKILCSALAKQFSWYCLLFLLLIANCSSCFIMSPKKPVLDAKTSKILSRLVIDPAKISTMAPNFSYKSKLEILVGPKGETEKNRELIAIDVNAPRLLFFKKIDDAHFFSIMKNDDAIFIKNLEGPWRKGSDNKFFYQELIHDGFNLAAWLVDQFALDQSFTEVEGKHQGNFVIRNGVIKNDAPFIQQLAIKNPAFSKLVKSKLDASVIFDEQGDFPSHASFDISLNGEENSLLRIKASMSIKLSALDSDIEIPEIVDGGSLDAAPINIAPRFKDLVEQRRAIDKK